MVKQVLEFGTKIKCAYCKLSVPPIHIRSSTKDNLVWCNNEHYKLWLLSRI